MDASRSFANLQERDQTLRYVQLASKPPGRPKLRRETQNQCKAMFYVSTGEALSTIGDHVAAMERYRKALAATDSDRVSIRLAIAQLMAEQGHSEDAERQIALAQMEGEQGRLRANRQPVHRGGRRVPVHA